MNRHFVNSPTLSSCSSALSKAPLSALTGGAFVGRFRFARFFGFNRLSRSSGLFRRRCFSGNVDHFTVLGLRRVLRLHGGSRFAGGIRFEGICTRRGSRAIQCNLFRLFSRGSNRSLRLAGGSRWSLFVLAGYFLFVCQRNLFLLYHGMRKAGHIAQLGGVA